MNMPLQIPIVVYLNLYVYKVVVTFTFIIWINPKVSAIQTKAIEQYFPVVLFIMLYKVVLTFEFVDEILKWDHSDENY